MQLPKYSRSLALAAICFLAFSPTHAQRRGILITELVDVPISLATSTKPTREQVRDTIIAAAIAAQWDIDPQPDGALRASAVREFDTRVAVDVYYTEATYSIRYFSSENLSYSAWGERYSMPIPIQEYMADWRSSRSKRHPEFKYAVDKVGPVINPSYEGYVYELSASIRRYLRWALR